MVQSFYEWYTEAKKSNNDGFSAKDLFEAGQQSKQGEVHQLQTEIDELRKRISKVIHVLTYTNHASTPLCNELREILKGEETK